jgi:hypothetical protein
MGKGSKWNKEPVSFGKCRFFVFFLFFLPLSGNRACYPEQYKLFPLWSMRRSATLSLYIVGAGGSNGSASAWQELLIQKKLV